MGQWRITIEGTGCHHNGKREIDADLAAADFVAGLKAQGHTLRRATMEQMPVELNPNHPSNIDFLAEKPSDAAA